MIIEEGLRRSCEGSELLTKRLVFLVLIWAHDLLRKIVEVDPELLLTYLLQRRGRSQDNILALLEPLIAESQADGSVPDVVVELADVAGNINEVTLSR